MSDRQSVWYYLVKAGANAADASVDVTAIAAVAFMAVSGVPTDVLQPVGTMVVSVALGKRYMQRDMQPAGSSSAPGGPI